MRKYKLLGATAVALLITGTSLMAGNEDGNNTYYGENSNAFGDSVSIGTQAGFDSFPESDKNTLIGFQSGMKNHGGSENTYVGYQSGFSEQQEGNSNVAIGAHSGFFINGSSNVMIGKNSGREANASSSIYIGDGAGFDNERDETLIIDNNGYGTTPLIYGEFDNKMLRVNGTMEVNGTIDGKWEGSNIEGDGLTKLMVLEATNSEESKTSDAGFVLRNGRTGNQWNFRTMNDGNGFAATIDGTGGTEFQIVNDTNDFKNAKLYIGGVLVFADGKIQKNAIQP